MNRHKLLKEKTLSNTKKKRILTLKKLFKLGCRFLLIEPNRKYHRTIK